MFNKLKTKFLIILPVLVIVSIYLTGCSSNDEELGIGPVKEVKLGSIDQNLVNKGKTTFETKCASCHKFDTRLVGPPLGYTETQTGMDNEHDINPQQMTQENPLGNLCNLPCANDISGCIA
jgi:hypothetical protein